MWRVTATVAFGTAWRDHWLVRPSDGPLWRRALHRWLRWAPLVVGINLFALDGWWGLLAGVVAFIALLYAGMAVAERLGIADPPERSGLELILIVVCVGAGMFLLSTLDSDPFALRLTIDLSSLGLACWMTEWLEPKIAKFAAT